MTPEIEKDDISIGCWLKETKDKRRKMKDAAGVIDGSKLVHQFADC